MYANFKIIFLLLLAQIVNGRRINNITSGIFFGKEIDISQAKFVVQVIFTIPPIYADVCAGTLLSPIFVLTADHCTTKSELKDIFVIGGATRYLEGGRRRRVRHKYLPEDWVDIALLRLRAPLTGPNIQPIPLCNVQWGEGSHFKSYGWGKSKIGDRYVRSKPILREVQIPVLNPRECEDRYGKLIYARPPLQCVEIVTTRGSFSGNSGGPAVINNSLCAVSTLGFRHPIEDVDVFIDIRFIKDFIVKHLSNTYAFR